MTWTRTATAALAAASLAAALGACTGAKGLESPTQSTAASPTQTLVGTTKPTTTSPTMTYDPNSPQVRAKEAVRNYFEVSDTCLQEPTKAKATCFDAVAITSALNDLRSALSSAQAAQTKQIGFLEVVSAELLKIDLTNAPKGTPPAVPNLTFSVCYDVSKVNVVDYSGKSIVPPDRKPRAIENVTVVNYKYPDPTQWRVGYVVPTNKSC